MAYHRAAPAVNLAIHHANVIFGYRLVDAAADIKSGIDPAASFAGRAAQYQSLTAGNRRLARFAPPCTNFAAALALTLLTPQMRQHRDAGRWKFNDFTSMTCCSCNAKFRERVGAAASQSGDCRNRRGLRPNAVLKAS